MCEDVLRVNPAKSKHLETAVIKLMGYEVNFTHLRSETYSEDSRIPVVV
jgi:tRNA nucleotidyltransferase (CCA-adding enzyme)